MKSFTLMGKLQSPSSVRSQLGHSTPTVLAALIELKKQQSQMLKQQKRYKVLTRHIDRQNNSRLKMQQRQRFYSSIKQSISRDKAIKKQQQRKKQKNIQMRYSLNNKHKQQNKAMIQNVKKKFLQMNHKMYQQIRERKKENQEFIKAQRSIVLNSRVDNRKKIQEQQEQKRKSLQNFYKSRVIQIKNSKINDIKFIQNKKHQKMKWSSIFAKKNIRLTSSLASSRSLSNHSIRNNPENI